MCGEALKSKFAFREGAHEIHTKIFAGNAAFYERTSQSLCKPPVWCRIEAPHRRNYK